VIIPYLTVLQSVLMLRSVARPFDLVARWHRVVTSCLTTPLDRRWRSAFGMERCASTASTNRELAHSLLLVLGGPRKVHSRPAFVQNPLPAKPPIESGSLFLTHHLHIPAPIHLRGWAVDMYIYGGSLDACSCRGPGGSAAAVRALVSLFLVYHVRLVPDPSTDPYPVVAEPNLLTN